MAENANMRGPVNTVPRDCYCPYYGSSMQQTVHQSCDDGKTTADMRMPHGALEDGEKDEEARDNLNSLLVDTNIDH